MGRMRRRWRSNSPRERKSAKVSWSRIGEPRSASSLASANGSTSSRRQDEPAEPEPGREGLAGGPGVGDPVGIEALHRADRGAVVAVLGVVVVLEHQRAGSLRPGEHRGARLRGEHAAGRPLVRRGEDQDVGVEVGQRVDAHAVVADRHADHVQARARCAIGRASSEADGSSTATVLAPAGGQHSDQQRDRLRVAVGDDDRLGIGVGAAHTVEVGGERRAQLHRAVAVEVAETLVGGLGEDAAHGAQPGGPREGRDVAAAVAEVDHGARPARRGRPPRLRCGRRRYRGRRGRHLRVAAAAAGQVALGHELRVRLDDDSARDAQLGRQRAGRRQRDAGRQGVRSGSARGSTPRSGGAARPRRRGPGRSPAPRRETNWSANRS